MGAEVEEQIAVVDEHNRFVRWERRSVIHAERLLHRSVYVLVVDSMSRLLIQQRHRDKQTFPSYWDLSCAGHLCAEDYPAGPDEDLEDVYAATASRELEEELGIRAPLTMLGVLSPDPTRYEHVRLYLARHDGPVVFQEEEVEAVRWVSREDLAALAQEDGVDMTPTLRALGCRVWSD
jgi:isopentenyl-diphosphate delta-isomerase type 1